MLSFTAPATVTWPDVVTAIATALTTLILAAAGAVAALQLSETRSLRQAQVRPFVVIDFDVETIPPFIYIVISNVGTTMASNVTFAFDRPIESSLDDRGGNRPNVSELPIFRDGVRSLPPAKEIRFLFDSFIQRETMPDTYLVTVKYDGHVVRRWPRRTRRQRYKETITLDLGMYRQMTRIDRRGLHEIHERLKEIRDEMKKWTASGRGLLRLSPDDVRAREQARREAMQAEAERRRHDEGDDRAPEND